MKVHVKSLCSPRTGNPVANQFSLQVGNDTYFQSYTTIIAKIASNGEITLDAKSWDYSHTTLKYLKEFLGITYSKKEILDCIKKGVYKVANLN